MDYWKALFRTILAAVLVFIASSPINALSVPEHHVENRAVRLCDGSWKSTATYFGELSERVFVANNVVVNGEKYNPNWTTEKTFVPLSEFSGDKTGLPTGSEIYVLLEEITGFSIFDRSGQDYKAGAENWSGQVELYVWAEFSQRWKKVDTDPVLDPGPIPECPGTVVINKVAEWDKLIGDKKFTVNVSTGEQNADYFFKVGKETNTVTMPAIGDFTVTLNEHSFPDHWRLVSIVCTRSGEPIGNPFEVNSNEEVVCTVTNTNEPVITYFPIIAKAP